MATASILWKTLRGSRPDMITPHPRFLELGAKYAPQPPFGAGTPDGAGPELTALAREFYATLEHGLRAD